MLRHLFALAGAALLLSACAGPKQPLPQDWARPLEHVNANNHHQILVYPSTVEDRMMIVAPGGIEVISGEGGQEAHRERERRQVRVLGIRINLAGQSLLEEKMTFVPVEGRDAVLVFDYRQSREKIELIDFATGEVVWTNEELRWSLERFAEPIRAIGGLAEVLGARGAESAAHSVADSLFPEPVVEDLVSFVPGRNDIILRTFGGFAYLDLDTGEAKWTVDGIHGGLTAVTFHEPSNSIVVVNNDDRKFLARGIQRLDKQIARIHLETGEVLWSSRYHGEVSFKNDGLRGRGSRPAADVRVVGDYVITNFRNMEVFDFATGESLWRTRLGAMAAAEAAFGSSAGLMDAWPLPVFDGETAYRFSHRSVVGGVKIFLQSYDLASGEMHWETEVVWDAQAHTLDLWGDLIMVSTSDNRLLALRPDDGEIVWEHFIGARTVSRPPVFYDDHLWILASPISLRAITAGSSILRKVSREDGSTLQEVDVIKLTGPVSDVHLGAGRAVITGRKGIATVDLASGSLVQSTSAPARGNLRPVPGGFVVFSSQREGVALLLDEDGTLLGTLWRNPEWKTWFHSPNSRAIYVLTEAAYARPRRMDLIKVGTEREPRRGDPFLLIRYGVGPTPPLVSDAE